MTTHAPSIYGSSSIPRFPNSSSANQTVPPETTPPDYDSAKYQIVSVGKETAHSDGSIIDVADFDRNVTRLAEHLQECMRNETLCNSYHEWRSLPLPEWFQRQFNFTWTTTECCTCRYMHALQNGWEWDKENQRGIPPQAVVVQ